MAEWQERVRKASRRKVTRSHNDGETVSPSPESLLAAARSATDDGELSLDVYAAARLCASEHGSGSPEELACIIDAESNRSGPSLFAHLCPTGTFGAQGRNRPASTRLDPTFQHLEAARAVLESREARGIARGARRFFDPRAMDAQHRKNAQRVSCDALGVLDAWTFARPRSGGTRCDPKTGRSSSSEEGPEGQQEQWVGPIEGVNAFELMLMERRTNRATQLARFAAAELVIRHGRDRRPLQGFIPALLAWGALELLGRAA